MKLKNKIRLKWIIAACLCLLAGVCLWMYMICASAASLPMTSVL